MPYVLYAKVACLICACGTACFLECLSLHSANLWINSTRVNSLDSDSMIIHKTDVVVRTVTT